VQAACAQHYAETLINPFDTPAGACVPMPPTLASVKRKIFARGTGHCQAANGFGGIVANSSCVQDLACAKVTSGTGVGDNINNAHFTEAFNNSELTSNVITEGNATGRLVGWGIRLRYIGKQVDMNGTVYALEEPTHLPLYNATISDLLKYDRVKKVPFDRNWVVACWQPVYQNDTGFNTNVFFQEGPGGQHQQAGNEMLGILISVQASGAPGSTPAASLPFEWEWYAHYETIGSNVRGKTISHAAPVLASNVLSAISQAPTTAFDAAANGRASTPAMAKQSVEHGSGAAMRWGEFATRLAQGAAYSLVGAATRAAAGAMPYMALAAAA